MNLIPITNKAKSITAHKDFNLYCFRERVLCFDNQPGYLFVSTTQGWFGIWVREKGDKDFKIEGELK